MHEVLHNYQARLLLQHDELIFEVPPNEWQEWQLKIHSVMESAVQLSVPLLQSAFPGQIHEDVCLRRILFLEVELKQFSQARALLLLDNKLIFIEGKSII